jgi:hypothetical protein
MESKPVVPEPVAPRLFQSIRLKKLLLAVAIAPSKSFAIIKSVTTTPLDDKVQLKSSVDGEKNNTHAIQLNCGILRQFCTHDHVGTKGPTQSVLTPVVVTQKPPPIYPPSSSSTYPNLSLREIVHINDLTPQHVVFMIDPTALGLH